MLFDERWRGTEKRAGYTEQLTRQLIADATGGVQRDPSATAAAEAAISAYARAFAIAEVSPTTNTTAPLTPALLSLIVRNILRTGESVHYLDVRDGVLRVLPAGSHNVHGGPDPDSWYYRITTYGPSGSRTVVVPATDTLHFVYSIHPHRPWRGVAPLSWAALTGRLHAELEDMLGDESSGARGYLLPLPAGPDEDGDEAGTDDPQAKLRADIAGARGRVVTVETTSAGFGEGPSSAPQKDWVPTRLGIDAPQAAVNLRSDSAMAVLAALGVPPQLFHAGGTTPIREALRTWLHTGITPLSELVAREWSEKVSPVAFSFDRLYASDITSRSRALGQMTTAAVPLDEARRLSGLL